MKGLSPKLAKAFEIVESDVRHWYETYSGEAMCACRKLTEKLKGDAVLYSVSGSEVLRGVIEQIIDQSGCLRIIIRCIPKRGKGGIHIVSPLQIIKFVTSSKIKSRRSENDD